MSDDDNEGLVRRTPVLFGLRFKDEEERTLVQKVGLASAGLVALSVMWFFAHLFHRGHFFHAFGHLLSSLALPAIGYLGVKNENPKYIWIFHLGNVQFAILHAVVGFVVFKFVTELEASDPQAVCQGAALHLPPAPEGVNSRPPNMIPTQPPFSDTFAQCVADMQAEQDHAPYTLLWWLFVTAPLWFLMIYAAYQAHEYYFRLRIRNLTARSGESGGMATVTEREEGVAVE